MSTKEHLERLTRDPLDRFFHLPFAPYVPTDGCPGDFLSLDQHGLVRVAIAAFSPELNKAWAAADLMAYEAAFRRDPYAPRWAADELIKLFRH